jgi:hypothetical protein
MRVLIGLAILFFMGSFVKKGWSAIYHQASAVHTIRSFQIFGERASGTNYLEQLLKKNFPSYLITWKYGWKHFPCWYDTPWVTHFHYDTAPEYSQLSGSQDALVIVIFRNPYDWLRSFYSNPWHIAKNFNRSSFSRFIREKWRLEEHTFHYDLNPHTLCCFQNVLEMRTAKIKNLLKIKQKAPNVYYINYETLRDQPAKCIAEMSRLFKLRAVRPFQPVTRYKGGNARYIPKRYPPIFREDLLHINRSLDEAVEKKIGYRLINGLLPM